MRSAIGGFVATTLPGVIKGATGSHPPAVLSRIGCVLVFALGRNGMAVER